MVMKVKDVDLDLVIDTIFRENLKSPDFDIFDLIQESLGDNYSLDDFVDYIIDKPIIKKRLEDIFLYQNYARSISGEVKHKEDNIKDLI